jgi:hypothetical protein
MLSTPQTAHNCMRSSVTVATKQTGVICCPRRLPFSRTGQLLVHKVGSTVEIQPLTAATL